MLVGRLRRVPEDSASGASRSGPRSVQDWRGLLAVYAITALIESTGVSQVFAFLPLRLHQMGLLDAEVASFTGIFTALIFVFGIFLVPFWGVWADKYSRRAVIVRSALVEMVVFAGVALAREPWQLAVALLLTGLQLGNTGVMLAALRDVSPTHRIGTVSAAFGATGPVGFALGPILGGFIVDGLHLPLTSVFWLGSVLSAASVILLMTASRDVRPTTVPVGRSVDLAVSAVRSAVSDPQVRRLFLIFGVAILGSLMARPYLPILVQGLIGSGPGLASAIGLVVGTAGLVGALASPGAGPLGDRLGLRPVLVGTLLIGGISVAVMPLAPSVALLAAVAVVFAAANAGVQAMVFALVAVETPSDRRSATLNLVLLPLYVAGIIGPSLAAGFAAVAGVSAIYPIAGTIMVVTAVILAGLLRRQTGRDTAPRSDPRSPAS
jgi:DHA1 family multidrug resistance protein-like MFS transporter